MSGEQLHPSRKWAIEYEATEQRAKEHSRDPASYLERCLLCYEYIKALTGEPCGLDFWQKHQEYLHSLSDKISIIYEQDLPWWILKLKVFDGERLTWIFSVLSLIRTEDITIATESNIMELNVYEPCAIDD